MLLFFPSSLHRLIANCGHLPHEESPSNVVILLTQLLGEVTFLPQNRRVRAVGFGGPENSVSDSV
eukprot:1124109-Prorocentrum_minimum.AAC.1